MTCLRKNRKPINGPLNLCKTPTFDETPIEYMFNTLEVISKEEKSKSHNFKPYHVESV